MTIDEIFLKIKDFNGEEVMEIRENDILYSVNTGKNYVGKASVLIFKNESEIRLMRPELEDLKMIHGVKLIWENKDGINN